MKPTNARWAIFISGLGSNAAELLDARAEYDIALVVSSRLQAPGLARARRQGVETLVLNQPVDWSLLFSNLKQRKITHLFLAGFLKIVPASFLEKWQGVIVNVHPSLLPNYPGLDSLRRAYQERAPVGVTTHHVIAEVDSGHHIFQSAVGSLEEQQSISFEDVEWRAHLLEHALVKKTMEAVS